MSEGEICSAALQMLVDEIERACSRPSAVGPMRAEPSPRRLIWTSMSVATSRGPMRLVAVPDDEELKTRLYLLANMHNVTFVDGSAK
jgi:hypothetical protein